MLQFVNVKLFVNGYFKLCSEKKLYDKFFIEVEKEAKRGLSLFYHCTRPSIVLSLISAQANPHSPDLA